MAAPKERNHQPTEALAYANDIRLARARFRRRVNAMPTAEGRIKLARLLERGSYPVYLAGMPLAKFLKCCNRFGDLKATRTIVAARARHVPLRDLTPRERGSLAAELRQGRS